MIVVRGVPGLLEVDEGVRDVLDRCATQSLDELLRVLRCRRAASDPSAYVFQRAVVERARQRELLSSAAVRKQMGRRLERDRVEERLVGGRDCASQPDRTRPARSGLMLSEVVGGLDQLGRVDRDFGRHSDVGLDCVLGVFGRELVAGLGLERDDPGDRPLGVDLRQDVADRTA